MTDQEIENEIQAKGLTAPRLNPEAIKSKVKEVVYHRFPGTCTITCCIILENGFTTIGYSSPASPANFDEEIGKNIAYQNAYQQIWPLEGYLLRQQLYKESLLK